MGGENKKPKQDVALPLMMDPRFEEDTLFLVFEEDFRFEPEPDVDVWRLLRPIGTDADEHSERAASPVCSVRFSRRWPRGRASVRGMSCGRVPRGAVDSHALDSSGWWRPRAR